MSLPLTSSWTTWCRRSWSTHARGISATAGYWSCRLKRRRRSGRVSAGPRNGSAAFMKPLPPNSPAPARAGHRRRQGGRRPRGQDRTAIRLRRDSRRPAARSDAPQRNELAELPSADGGAGLTLLGDLAEIGVLLLMLVAGLETDLQEMRRVGKTAFWSASVALSFRSSAGANRCIRFPAVLGRDLHRHDPDGDERQHLRADADRTGRPADARRLHDSWRRCHRRRHRNHRPVAGRRPAGASAAGHGSGADRRSWR